MAMKLANIILTNNPKVVKEINSVRIKTLYYKDYSFMDILYNARDLIHKGHKLLTHPIVSGIKPNETPYKTIVLSDKEDTIDLESLELIENSINLSKNFLDKARRHLTPSIREDFELIDYKLIKEAIENIL